MHPIADGAVPGRGGPRCIEEGTDRVAGRGRGRLVARRPNAWKRNAWRPSGWTRNASRRRGSEAERRERERLEAERAARQAPKVLVSLPIAVGDAEHTLEVLEGEDPMQKLFEFLRTTHGHQCRCLCRAIHKHVIVGRWGS